MKFTVKERVDDLMKFTIVPAIEEDFTPRERAEALTLLKHSVARMQ